MVGGFLIGAGPGHPFLQGFRRQLRLDRLHILPGLIRGRGDLPVIHIHGKGDIAFTGKFRRDGLNLVIETPPFMDQQNGRRRCYLRINDRGRHRLTAIERNAHVLGHVGRRPRQNGISQNCGKRQGRRALHDITPCIHDVSLLSEYYLKSVTVKIGRPHSGGKQEIKKRAGITSRPRL